MDEPGKVQPQTQEQQPGSQQQMRLQPNAIPPGYQGSGKLAGRVAPVTGGDSGIGREVAVAYAKEGADVSIVYLNEHEDANETRRLVEETGRKCLLIAGDIGDKAFAGTPCSRRCDAQPAIP